jgi:hypothetical protein
VGKMVCEDCFSMCNDCKDPVNIDHLLYCGLCDERSVCPHCFDYCNTCQSVRCSNHNLIWFTEMEHPYKSQCDACKDLH